MSPAWFVACLLAATIIGHVLHIFTIGQIPQ